MSATWGEYTLGLWDIALWVTVLKTLFLCKSGHLQSFWAYMVCGVTHNVGNVPQRWFYNMNNDIGAIRTRLKYDHLLLIRIICSLISHVWFVIVHIGQIGF